MKPPRDMTAEVKAAYKRLFRHPDAKLVLADLATFCNVTTSAYESGMDAIELAINEGKRRVGLRLFAMTALSPHEILEAGRPLKTEPGTNSAEEE